MPVLTAVDVVAIQHFVFSSNKLRDVVAGSWMVHWSTSREGALANYKDNVILASGGNAILRFRDIEEAKDFAAKYTRSLYEEVPGLQVVVVHKEYKKGELANALLEIGEELTKAKLSPHVHAHLPGISVTATCRETGLPAAGFDPKEPDIPLSWEIIKRREKLKDAISRWSAFLPDPERYEFPLELDDLGRSFGETSLIGIVHIDGNGVGNKIKGWLEEMEGKEDEVVVEGYKRLSRDLDELGTKAFKAVVDRVVGAVDDKRDPKIVGKPEDLGFKLKRRGGKVQLPLRPILLGGDDITFVCDGRLALDLAITGLKVFLEEDVSQLGRITASAGVALVRVHDPFFRAYRLCEELCSSAKRRLKKEAYADKDCAIDWHIGLPHPSQNLEYVRESFYSIKGYRLTARPYLLNEGPVIRTWCWFEKLLEFLRSGPWKNHRNKVKKLLNLCYSGPGEVERRVKSWAISFPELSLPSKIGENGFYGDLTPLVDAVELIDMHMKL